MAAGGNDEITVPAAAKLLGLKPHSVYALIDKGELRAEVDRPADRPRRRRVIRLRRQDVKEYLERARVKPGQLRHLHTDSVGRYSQSAPPPTGAA